MSEQHDQPCAECDLSGPEALAAYQQRERSKLMVWADGDLSEARCLLEEGDYHAAIQQAHHAIEAMRGLIRLNGQQP